MTRADTGSHWRRYDAAIDAADVGKLMFPQASDVPAAIRLSRATLRNIHENLFWAFTTPSAFRWQPAPIPSA